MHTHGDVCVWVCVELEDVEVEITCVRLDENVVLIREDDQRFDPRSEGPPRHLRRRGRATSTGETKTGMGPRKNRAFSSRPGGGASLPPSPPRVQPAAPPPPALLGHVQGDVPRR